MRGKAVMRRRSFAVLRITPAYAGKEPEAAPTSARGGITPAYAGKRIWASSAKTFLRNHPRVCGEKPVVIAVWTAPQGITPACAGKSPERRSECHSHRDHPRVCGEKVSFQGAARRIKGSPPRVRGKGKLRQCYRLAAGITPACAGKSTRGTDAGKPCQDHPRVCGEKTTEAAAAMEALGSPPRVRGKE